MIFIRLTASCFIYLLIFLLIGTLLTLGIYVWTQPINASAGVTSMFSNNFTRSLFSIVCFILAGAILLFVCCYRSRISLAAKITEVSSKFVANYCLITVVPLVMFLITLALLALWVVEALGYYSLGTPVNCNSKCYPFQHFNLPTSVYILLGVHVFALLWQVFFMIGANGFITCGTAC